MGTVFQDDILMIVAMLIDVLYEHIIFWLSYLVVQLNPAMMWALVMECV